MPGQRISNLFNPSRALLSVEFFPPRQEEGARQILRTAKALQRFKPDFVSITYGAGGSTRERTLAYGELLKDIFEFEVMPHLTAVGHTQGELADIMRGFAQAGFRNVMALRGDPPKGQKEFVQHEGGFRYGSEVVAFIRQHFPDFGIGCGGYPEVHPDSPNREVDLDWLAHKVRQGADFITTQLFFDNADFYRFRESLLQRGITVPVVPGILPALSQAQLERLVQFCKAGLPEELLGRLKAASDNEEEAALIGVDWAYEQIADLIRNGCPGVHLYIMNRSDSAVRLIQRLRDNGLL